MKISLAPKRPVMERVQQGLDAKEVSLRISQVSKSLKMTEKSRIAPKLQSLQGTNMKEEPRYMGEERRE
jgi:hypothetical protein